MLTNMAGVSVAEDYDEVFTPNEMMDKEFVFLYFHMGFYVTKNNFTVILAMLNTNNDVTGQLN